MEYIEMTKLKFSYDWLVAGNDAPEYNQTTAMLALHVGNVNLMKNHDIWSKTIRETVLASAYPLAMWLTSSWWRLNWEPLPAHGVRPSVDWRMAHELGAADHGFVWPQIIFASDCEVMQVWAVPLSVNDNQSVNYLNGLELPASIALTDFQRSVEDFITDVIRRLNATGCANTELSNLWQLIQEERVDHESAKYRRVEAEMGYDPDECPEELMDKALSLDLKMGTSALSELAPIYGKLALQTPLATIEEMADSPGLVGAPRVPSLPRDESARQGMPWQRAVVAAGELRKMLGNPHGMIDNNKLSELLGLNAPEVEQWSPAGRNDAAIAVPCRKNQFKFIPRKKHPIAKRFELARFIGDYLLTARTNGNWLTSTDLSTSRQKFQRAFAAEFLCPIETLQDFLRDDYSESAIEDAALHFQVSQRTIESLLVNNGVLLPPSCLVDYTETRLPYQLDL
ncbi:MAG: ImmA/IrrE family metallo-endopeptidase [Syntrophales bacterium]